MGTVRAVVRAVGLSGVLLFDRPETTPAWRTRLNPPPIVLVHGTAPPGGCVHPLFIALYDRTTAPTRGAWNLS